MKRETGENYKQGGYDNAKLSQVWGRDAGGLHGKGGGRGYGVVLSTQENKLFSGRIGKPRVAVCPVCGEVSIYLEDVDKLKEGA